MRGFSVLPDFGFRRRSTRPLIRIALALALLASPAAAQDLTLTDVMTHADLATYREVPFKVPAGVTAVTVAFEYQGKEERSVIDLGVRDPQRFRGWRRWATTTSITRRRRAGTPTTPIRWPTRGAGRGTMCTWRSS